LNTQISAAIEEQSVVSEQISRSVVAISDMAKHSEEQSSKSVSMSKELLIRLNDQHNLITQVKD
jgi:methyl-accepting chemotaxis protein